MGCITKEQWKEVYKQAVEELADRDMLGEDTSEARQQLNDMNKAMVAGFTEQARAIAEEAAKKDVWLDSSAVALANKHKPMVGKTKVTVEGIRKDADGNVFYLVKYPSGKKATKGWYAISMEGMHPKYNESILGSIAGAVYDEQTKYEKLEFDIWNGSNEAAMKLFDDMVELDGVKDEHTDELRTLVEKMTEPANEIFNKFKVLMNKEAEVNHGFAVPYGKYDSRIELNVNASNVNKNGMSAAEVYAHELIHMSVETARQFRKGPLANVIGDLNKLYNEAAEFVTVDKLVAKGMTKDAAEAAYKYMFANDETGISEFIAYGMTNKAVKAVLSEMQPDDDTKKSTREGWFGTVLNKLIEIYDILRDMMRSDLEKGKADERLGYLVTSMWEHNNISVKSMSRWKQIRAYLHGSRAKIDTKIIDAAKYANTKIAGAANSVLDSMDNKDVAQKLRQFRRVTDYINPFLEGKDQVARDAAIAELRDDLADGAGADLFRPEGLWAGFLSMLSKDDSLQVRVEKLALIANKVDQHRHDTTIAVGGDILSSIGKEVSIRAQQAITNAVLRTDAKALLDSNTDSAEVNKLIMDKEHRAKEIARVEKLIKDTLAKEATKYAKHNKLDVKAELDKATMLANYYRAQANALGRYMITGIGGRTVNTNAVDIVAGKGAEEVLADFDITTHQGYIPNITEYVDRLATLKAIDNVKKQDIVEYSKVMKGKDEAVSKIMKYHIMYDTRTEHFMQSNNLWDTKIKGAIKNIDAKYKESKVASNDKATKKAMKKKGYYYKGATAVEGKGLYVKMSPDLAEFEKQGFAKINLYKRVHSTASEILASEGVSEHAKKSAEQHIAELNSSFIGDKDILADIVAQLEGEEASMDGYLPIYGFEGDLIDYAITIDNDVYESAMDTETSIAMVAGRMVAELQEKIDTLANNNLMLSAIFEDMKANYDRGERLGKNYKDYIELGPDAVYRSKTEAKRAKELWENMPQYVRNQILQLKVGARFVAIRRDMAEDYIGARVPSILDAKMPFNPNGRNLGRVLSDNDLDNLKEIIKITEQVWDEATGFAKSTIVVRLPATVITNIVSNIEFSMALGAWPWEVLADTVKLMKATRDYLALKKKRASLSYRYNAGIERTPEAKAQLARYRAMMEASPVHATMSAGLFTAKMEDISMPDLEGKGVIEGMLGKYTDKIPTIIKDAAGAIYLTGDNPVYKALLMLTQFSDFVFRTMRYNILISEGKSHDEAIKMVTDEAVNYNKMIKPTVARYIDKKMMFPFSKYFIGTNKVLIDKIKTAPSAVLQLLLMQGVVPSPMDAAVPYKNYSAAINSPLDVMETGIELVTRPAALRAVGLV